MIKKTYKGLAGLNSVVFPQSAKAKPLPCLKCPEIILQSIWNSNPSLSSSWTADCVFVKSRNKRGVMKNGVTLKAGTFLEFDFDGMSASSLSSSTHNTCVGHVKNVYECRSSLSTRLIVMLKIERYVIADKYKSVYIIKTFGSRDNVFVNLESVHFVLHLVPHWTQERYHCMIRTKVIRY